MTGFCPDCEVFNVGADKDDDVADVDNNGGTSGVHENDNVEDSEDDAVDTDVDDNTVDTDADDGDCVEQQDERLVDS